MNLNDIKLDHVFEVRAGVGIVDTDGSVYAPELHDEALDSDRWEFVSTGYSNQFGYSGPIMHNSEYIGGRLERAIRETPGIYAIVPAYWSGEDEYDEGESVIEGWAVVRYIYA